MCHNAFVASAPVGVARIRGASITTKHSPFNAFRRQSSAASVKMAQDNSDQEQRRRDAKQLRINAANLAFNRGVRPHESNGDESDFNETLIGTFTKGLQHNTETGQIFSRDLFDPFRASLATGDPADFKEIRLGPKLPKNTPGRWQSTLANGAPGLPFESQVKARAWESAGAGLAFDLEGPDAQAVTMPPAPKLASAELEFEIAELYFMALARDIPFSLWDSPDTKAFFDNAIATLSALPWVSKDFGEGLTDEERFRREGKLNLTTANIFRGYGAGVRDGPYISQYLIRGSQGLGTDGTATGQVMYGALGLDLRVRSIEPRKDWMTTWEAFIDVQDGADVRQGEFPDYKCAPDGSPIFRFITDGRDLSTYVHYDALYEAYLNACFALLADGVGVDTGLPFRDDDEHDKQTAFATFGGPHILSLVCEVATRALKAVRYQKFQIHLRARPEAVGGLIHAQKSERCDFGEEVRALVARLDECGLLDLVADKNMQQNQTFADRVKDRSASSPSYLLPMAFPEGSPMHPSYGAGHGTVAGACTIILKAFFNTVQFDGKCDVKDAKPSNVEFTPLPNEIFEADAHGCLQPVCLPDGVTLTVDGELNKIANNVAFGRSLAGVHWSSDNIESLILGEEVARGILEEQVLTFAEQHSFTYVGFDGHLNVVRSSQSKHELNVDKRDVDVFRSDYPVA